MGFILAVLTALLLTLPGCTATQNLGGDGVIDLFGADAFEDESGDPVFDLGPRGGDPVEWPPIPDGGLRVFVTSTRHAGDLGGLAGADAICTARADEAGLGGRWVAWLSDSQVDAIDRIEGDGPWYRLDARLAFDDRTELASVARVPVNINDSGAAPGDRGRSYCFSAWTGTGTGGRRSGVATTEFCSDWTSSDAQHPDAPDFEHEAMTGDCDRIELWTEDYPSSCDRRKSLYCFEAP